MIILRASFPSWYISAHSLSSSSLCSKILYYRSLIHGTSLRLLSLSSFTPDSIPEFADATPWMSPIFNSLLIGLFTVDNFSPTQTSPSSSIPFNQPLLQCYIKHTAPLDLQLDTSIINPHHSIPKLKFLSSNNCLTAALVYHLQTSLILLTSDHPNPPKSCYCIEYII